MAVEAARTTGWETKAQAAAARATSWDTLADPELLTPNRLHAELRAAELDATIRAHDIRARTTAATLSVTTHAADLGGQLREEP